MVHAPYIVRRTMTLYSLQCALYIENCIIFGSGRIIVHRTSEICNEMCILKTRFTVYGVRRTLHYKVFDVYCTTYCVRCTTYSIRCTTYSI